MKEYQLTHTPTGWELTPPDSDRPVLCVNTRFDRTIEIVSSETEPEQRIEGVCIRSDSGDSIDSTGFPKDFPTSLDTTSGGRLTPEQTVFLHQVENQVAVRSSPVDWLPHALKVVHLVPDQMCAEAATLVFCRWLFGKPPHEHDGMMRDILPPVTIAAAGRD